MVITKDLGAVSAYAYAVEQGYQGTEEEFAELMARQATVAEEAAASADAAAESANEAQASAEQAEQSAQSISGDVERAEQAATTATGKATEAATSATTANGAAQTATGKAAQAEQSATAAANSASAAATSASNAAASATAAQTAKTAAETAQGKAEDAQAAAEAAAASIDPDTLVKKTELEDYAKIDGSYETMTVGNAEQLVATVGVDDNAPYNFRTSGGSVDIGDREMVNEIVGGTVAWNQLTQELNSAYWTTSNASVTYADGVATMIASAKYGGLQLRNAYSIDTLANHVYLMALSVKPTTELALRINFAQAGNAWTSRTLTAGAWNQCARYFKPTESYNGNEFYIQDSRSADWDAVDIKNCVMIDLTQLFGSNIADYLYSTYTASDCLQYFRKLFPKPFYEFNSGELLSVNTSQHKMVGFNAYNPETGTAHVVGGMQYQITGAYTALSIDGETVTPDANGLFTPSADGVLTVTGGNSSTTCVHLVWDGERDDTYEPYTEWVYPLDSSLTLRGIPKLDASGNLYYDGDTYAPDGTVTRRWKEIDLSTLVFTTRKTGSVNVAYSARLSSEYKGYSTIGSFGRSMVGDNLSYIHPSNALELTSHVDTVDVGIYSYENNGNNTATVYIVAPVGTEKSQFGNLLYLLATPTTETATPYTQIQSVDDFGTEEYTDYAYENGDRDVAIPVGNNTVYSPNLRAKLEMSPNSPDGDGLYVVEQSNGQNEYVPLVIPTELPTAPSEDGTYTLKITVSGGTVTKSWIAEE